MLSLDILRELFQYNYWARDRQLSACVALTQEQFLRPMGSSFTSVRDTTAHLLMTEWAYHERCRGRSPTAADAERFSSESLPDLETIRSRWRPVERDVRDFIGSLSDEKLSEEVTYVNLRGEQWTYTLWRILFHLINHQTYHRGQITTLLRQLGAIPPQIDFLVAHDVRFEV